MHKLTITCLIVNIFIRQILCYSPPVGIPSPVDSMGFDPLNIQRPDPLVKCPGWPNISSKINGNPCDCYYVDNSDTNATDISNLYGYPNKPRLTIPTSQLKPNSYMEIHGGHPYAINYRPNYKGSVDSLIWIVGKGNPLITTGIIDIGFASTYDSIRYIIFDSINVNSYTAVDLRPRYNGHHFSNIVFRGCEFYGRGISSDGTGVFLGPSTPTATDATLKNVVIYNCKIHDFGDKAIPGEECLIYATANTSNIWVLHNECYNAAEDGIAGGQVANHTVHGYFIGDNYIHDNLVNGIDLKQIYNLVISHNQILNHWGVTNDSEKPGQAIVLHYSGTSTPPGVWTHFPYYATVVNNVIDGSRQGIVTSFVFNVNITGNIITNIIHDPGNTYIPSSSYSPGTAMSIRGISGNLIIEKNSMSKIDGGVKIPDMISDYNVSTVYYNSQYVRYNGKKYVCINDNNNSGITGVVPNNSVYWKSCTLSIKNNLTMLGNESLDCDLQFQSATYGALFEFDKNDFWMSGDTSKIRWGGGYYDLTDFKAISGKCDSCLEANPSTVSNSNLRLKSNSILRGAGEAGYSSQYHYNLYRLYLNRDYDSTSIPNCSSYDIGAFQYKSSGVKPVSLKFWLVFELAGTDLDSVGLFYKTDTLVPLDTFAHKTVIDTSNGTEKRYYWFNVVPSDSVF